MAVLKDLEVVVTSGGRDLTEYEDQDDVDPGDAPSRVTKYVEATSGATFEIRCRIKSSFWFTAGGVSFEFHVDGVDVDGIPVSKKDFVSSRYHCVYNWDGERHFDSQGWSVRPLIFSEIKHVEESSTTGTQQLRSRHVGTIKIKVWRTDTPIAIDYVDEVAALTESLETAEKYLKGRNVTHSTRLGKARKTEDYTNLTANFIDKHPFAIFEFRYCSKKALQSLLLVPRSPSPPPDPALRSEDLTPDEIAELLRMRQARIKNEHRTTIKAERGIKLERDDEVDELIRSAVGRKVKQPRPFTNGEIVDLSTDAPEQRPIKREGDEEIEERLASARTKRMKVSKAPKDGEIVDLEDN